MKALARQNILKINPYKPGKPISEVKREHGLKNVIKLASNENPLGASPKATAAIRKALSSINLYPDGNCFSLKEKLAVSLKINSNSITFGNGSNELIELILKAFLNEGEEVLMSKPDFLIYKLATLQENGSPIEVPLKKFVCDLEAVREKITKKTKIIFIANPNNPIGTYVSKKNLENFIKKVPKNIIIVLDEAYFEFALEKDYPNGIDYVKFANVIVLRTFSKSYGLAGLRIGYAVTNAFFVDCLNKARQPFNVNSLAQAGAEAALSDKDFLNKTVTMTQEQKDYLYGKFEEMNLEYIKSATNFILLNCKTKGELVFDKLLKKGIIVRDMKAYGLDEWIRVTVGKPSENQKFIVALKKVLSV
ncbi:MAG: histidinol-phosphate transaminase [Candidatus Omnitrophota bacterium]